MKFIRKLFFLLIAVLLIWTGIFISNRVTDGFSIYQMSSSLPSYPQYAVHVNSQKKEELQKILDQTFYYLGKGCQFYAFESQDGKYVIKFLKHKHLRPFTALKAFPMPSALRKLCDAKMDRRKERADNLFSSCKLAYERMQEETGLLFIHIDRVAALGKKVIIVDKLGWKHAINIDEFEYFIQKKGETLDVMLKRTASHEIPEKFQQIKNLIISRCQKGISDRDRSFVQNIAFMDGKPVFIDFGQFYENPAMREQEEQTKDLRKRLGNMRAWLETHYPEYVNYLSVD